MSRSLPAWWASFSLAVVSLPETLQRAVLRHYGGGGLVPPLHRLSVSTARCRLVWRIGPCCRCRCLCLLQYLHHHRWMQLHISSREKSSSSIELRQVIQRSGCYLIYGQLHAGWVEGSWEFVHSVLSHQHFNPHVHICVSGPSPLISVHFWQSFQFCVFIPHAQFITILPREIRKFPLNFRL